MDREERCATSCDPDRRYNILVVGDWIVDEHWVSGIHRSPTASRTGRSHNLSLHQLGSTVESLCGAGRTASILDRAQGDNGELCNVHGIGAWHPDDTKVLEDLLDPAHARGQTPYRITRMPLDHSQTRGRLFNLSEVLRSDEAENAAPVIGTTHILRLYQQLGEKVELVQRIDWETRIPEGKRGWITSAAQLNDENLPTPFRGWKDMIDAVVIKDLCKGVVTDELIRWLVRLYGSKPWFISTKEWNPPWLKHLSNTDAKIDVRLFLVPQVAAQSAVRDEILGRWTTRSGHPTFEANEQINQLYKRFSKWSKHHTLLVLPDGSSILARDDQSKPNGLLQTLVAPAQLKVGTPMASVIYAALVAHLLYDERPALKDLVDTSLTFTHEWMRHEADRVDDPEKWDPAAEPKLSVQGVRR